MPNDVHNLTADIVVAGGGMSGVCAALAAARGGTRVVLIQDRSVLGGNASSEIRMHIVGADCHGKRMGWRESGLIEELRLADAAINPTRCYPLWDLTLYQAVKAEPNITLLLDTDVTGVTMETGGPPVAYPPKQTDRFYEWKGQPGRVKSVRAVRNTSEDTWEITARFFVDATGDGRVGVESGADFRIGREGQETHNESLALLPGTNGDGQTLGSSLLFTTRHFDHLVPFIPPPWARKFSGDDLKVGRHTGTWEYGFWWAEWGGQLDTMKDSPETIRHELYSIILGIWDYIKNSGDRPESANWALDWFGHLPGKREYRRFLGPHILTQADLQNGVTHKDDVAYGGWHIDEHPPSGVDAKTEKPCSQHWLDNCYGIPLRALFSRNIENLFFAGRNVSATHIAFASTRVMATCAVMGQAVGEAAAFCVRQNLSGPHEIVQSNAYSAALQQVLLKNDATLLGVHNTDPDDLAQAEGVQVSASSYAPGHEPARVLDGVTRDSVNGKDGALEQSHRWTSEPNALLPQWIELTFPEPVAVGEVHLTWDTGFVRPLMLTPSPNEKAWGVRGPQPETASRYRIEADGETVVRVENNIQRKCVHALSADLPQVSSLRVVVEAAHDALEARLFEIRAYSKKDSVRE